MTGKQSEMGNQGLRTRLGRACVARVIAAITLGAIGARPASAVTYMWDGGASGTGTDIGLAENWTSDTLPNPATTDIAQWTGLVGGNLSLLYNDAAFAGAVTNNGITLNLAGTQTGALLIDSGANQSVLRLNGITIAAGVGAFTLGDGADSFKIGLGGSGTRTFTNDSVNRATLNSDVSFSNGLAGPETFAFSGAGDWLIRANLAATNQAGNAVTKTGAGAVTFVGDQTYTGATTIVGGTIQLGDGVTDGSIANTSGISNSGSVVVNTIGTQSINNSISGAGSLVKNGVGTLTLAGQNTYYGATTVNGGTLNVPGAINLNTTANGGTITIGTATGKNTVMNVSGTVRSTSANPGLIIGTTAGSVGVMNVNGGTVSTAAEVWIGAAGTGQDGFGALVVNGGVVNSGSFLGTGRSTGANGHSRGELIVNGGAVNVLTNNLEIGSFQNTVASTSIATITAGTVTVGTSNSAGGSAIVGNNSNGILSLSGTASINVLNSSGTLRIGNNGTSGIVNLGSGTTVNVPSITRGTGNAVLNINGATLHSNATAATFLSGLSHVFIYSGGATIDNAGNNAVIDSMEAPTGNGVAIGSFVASGSGFAAPPIVEVTGGGGSGATAVANIDASGNLTGVTITNPGVGYLSAPNFSFVVGGGPPVTKSGSATLMPNASGGVTFTGGGVTTLTGASNYAGPTNLLAGTLVLTGSSLPDTATVTIANGTTLSVSGDERLGMLAGTGNLTVAGAHTFSLGTNVANSTFGGSVSISSTSVLAKVGLNVLTLSGESNSAGAVNVREGTLAVTGTLDNAGLVVAAPDNGTNGVLNVNAGGFVTGSEVWYENAGAASNTATGSGAIAAGGIVNSLTWTVVGRSGTAASTGTLNVNGGTLNVRTGSTTAGNLEVAVFDAVSGTANVNAGSKVNLFTNANVLLGAQNTTGNGTINQNGGAVTFYADAGGAIGGTGTLTLGSGTSSGIYTYNLNGGTLTVPSIGKTSSNTTARGVFSFNGGTLRAAVANATFIQGLTTASVKSGGAQIDSNGFNVTIGQPLVHDATLGATADGGINKLGNGTLTLNANNTYTGTTLISAGALVLSGNAKNAVLNLGGADLRAGATLTLNYVGSTSPASAVQTALAQGYGQPTSFSSSQIRATTLATGLTIGWIDDNATRINVAITLPGDFNLDHHVDFADLLTLAKNYNQSSGSIWQTGDSNYDGAVNFTDLLALAKNYNGVSPSSDMLYSSDVASAFAADWAAAQSLVPEPASLVALLSAATLIRARRRD